MNARLTRIKKRQIRLRRPFFRLDSYLVAIETVEFPMSTDEDKTQVQTEEEKKQLEEKLQQETNDEASFADTMVLDVSQLPKQ